MTGHSTPNDDERQDDRSGRKVVRLHLGSASTNPNQQEAKATESVANVFFPPDNATTGAKVKVSRDERDQPGLIDPAAEQDTELENRIVPNLNEKLEEAREHFGRALAAALEAGALAHQEAKEKAHAVLLQTIIVFRSGETLIFETITSDTAKEIVTGTVKVVIAQLVLKALHLL